MSITLEQAIRILHPDTLVSDARKAMWEVGCNPYNGPDMWRARDEATLLACAVMQREVGREKGCPMCQAPHNFNCTIRTQRFNDGAILALRLSGDGEPFIHASCDPNKGDATRYSFASKINFCPMCGKPLNDGKVDGDV